MRKWLIILGVIVLVLLVIYVVLGSFKPKRQAPAWLTAQPIAHRGLWTEGPEAPENSRAAFRAAAERGFAVELDVRLAADGALMVIHDDDLQAMTGTEGLVSEMTSLELADVRLNGGDELIPTLEEALDAVDGEVPVFVEIKNEGEVGPLEDAVAEELLCYDGEVAVMSFNPYSLQRIAALAPDIPRGQLTGSFRGEDLAWYKKFLLSNLLMNWTSRPDFIAWELTEIPSPRSGIQRLQGRPVLAWTANTPEERAEAAGHADEVICNPGALPEE